MHNGLILIFKKEDATNFTIEKRHSESSDEYRGSSSATPIPVSTLASEYDSGVNWNYIGCRDSRWYSTANEASDELAIILTRMSAEDIAIIRELAIGESIETHCIPGTDVTADSALTLNIAADAPASPMSVLSEEDEQDHDQGVSRFRWH